MDLDQVVRCSLVGALVVPLFLLGCSNKFDENMVGKQMDAEIAIAQAKSDAIVAQSQAIVRTLGESSTDLERYLARQQIVGLAITPSGLKSVTTGNDVVAILAEDGSTMIKDVVTGTVIWRGIVGVENILDSFGGTTVTAKEGSTLTYVNKDQKAVSGSGAAEVGDVEGVPQIEEVVETGESIE